MLNQPKKERDDLFRFKAFSEPDPKSQDIAASAATVVSFFFTLSVSCSALKM